MKKLLILVILVVIVVVFFGKRVYLRDPLGTVYRDEVKQSGVQVFINQDEEVLLVKEGEPGAYRVLVQHWDRFPGTPVSLICLPWTACVTEANNTPKLAIEWNGSATYDPKVMMTNREVSFVDRNGAKVRVELK
jgi:hypothetical protein